MKIRIEDHSIRLRLRRSEVEQLEAVGNITGHTPLPGGRFEYSLALNDVIEAMTAHKTSNGIRIELPMEKGRGWSDSEQVGFDRELVLDSGEPLRLLVEKDFVCLDRDPKSQKDQYPNPKAGTI